MNTRTTVSSASLPGDSASAAGLVMMSCEVCDLVGGPFPAAEAAHLHAIHDRLHHGIPMAA